MADYYLCHINEVTGGDNVFIELCISMCLCVAYQSIRELDHMSIAPKWFIIRTDFKFNVHF